MLCSLNHSVGVLFPPGCDTGAGDWQLRLQIISGRIASAHIRPNYCAEMESTRLSATGRAEGESGAVGALS